MKVNFSILSGNLVRDPELRDVGSTQVAKFTIAHTPPRFGQREPVTIYRDCEIWGRGAPVFCEHSAKGDERIVQGSIEVQRWRGENGEQKSREVLKVDQWTFGRPRAGGPDPGSGQRPPGGTGNMHREAGDVF